VGEGVGKAEGGRVSGTYFGIELKEGALWRNVLVMVAIMFVLQIMFQIWSIIFPRYLIEVAGLGRQHLGKVTGGMGVTYDIIRITFIGVFAALSDRFGRKMLLAAGALVSALSYLYFAFTPKMAVLLGINLILLAYVARIVIAFSMQIMSPQLLPSFFDYTPPHCRGRISSLYGFTMTCGVFLAYRTLGPLSKALPIQDFILLGTWISLGVILLTWFGVADLAPAREKVALKWESIWATTKRSFKNFSDAWPIVRKSPGLLFTYAVAFVEKSDISVQVYFLFAWVVAVARQIHMTRAEATAGAAIAISYGALMGLTTFFIGGFIIDRFGRKVFLMVGLLFSGLGFVFLGFLDNPLVMWGVAAIALRGFGTSAATLSALGLISDLSPKQLVGTIFGGYNMAAAAGMMIVVAISTFLFDYVGYGTPFILAGGMDLVVFVWGLFIWKKIPERKERPPQRGPS
jgi:MFS family permease